VLYREGETEEHLVAILRGMVAMVEGSGGNEHLLGIQGAGRLRGEEEPNDNIATTQ
jgi:CRP-like cAMP-binding protein